MSPTHVLPPDLIHKGGLMESKVKITCETEGFDEATDQVKTLAEAIDRFPTQVQLKDCHDCTINIYPSQTMINQRPD